MIVLFTHGIISVDSFCILRASSTTTTTFQYRTTLHGHFCKQANLHQNHCNTNTHLYSLCFVVSEQTYPCSSPNRITIPHDRKSEYWCFTCPLLYMSNYRAFFHFHFCSHGNKWEHISSAPKSASSGLLSPWTTLVCVVPLCVPISTADSNSYCSWGLNALWLDIQ